MIRIRGKMDRTIDDIVDDDIPQDDSNIRIGSPREQAEESVELIDIIKDVFQNSSTSESKNNKVEIELREISSKDGKRGSDLGISAGNRQDGDYLDSSAPPTLLTIFSYQNLVQPGDEEVKESGSESTPKDPVLQRGHKDSSNGSQLKNGRGGRTSDQLIGERPPDLPPRSHSETSSRERFKQRASTNIGEIRRYENIEPPFKAKNGGRGTTSDQLTEERPPDLPPRSHLETSSRDRFKQRASTNIGEIRRYENVEPPFNAKNGGRGTTSDQLTEERPPDLPPRSHLETSSRDRFNQGASTNIGEIRHYEPPFDAKKYIRNNIKTLSIPRLHSGSVVLLNDKDCRANVQFAELKPDIGQMRVTTETFRTLTHVNLMSGGTVVFEELSKAFEPLNSYAIDPIVVDELPDGLNLPHTTPFEVQPMTARPFLATSCSGGGIIEDDLSTKTSLPELFPVKKAPPATPQRSHSGGGIVEENEIYLDDLLKESLRFDFGEKVPKTPEDNNRNIL